MTKAEFIEKFGVTVGMNVNISYADKVGDGVAMMNTDAGEGFIFGGKGNNYHCIGTVIEMTNENIHVFMEEFHKDEDVLRIIPYSSVISLDRPVSTEERQKLQDIKTLRRMCEEAGLA